VLQTERGFIRQYIPRESNGLRRSTKKKMCGRSPKDSDLIFCGSSVRNERPRRGGRRFAPPHTSFVLVLSRHASFVRLGCTAYNAGKSYASFFVAVDVIILDLGATPMAIEASFTE